GEYCDLTAPDANECGKCTKICTADSDCKDAAKPTCNRVTGICGASTCTSDTQCTAPEVCVPSADGLSASCGAAPTTAVAACRVTSAGTTLAVGGTYDVSAIAFDADGKAVARAPFTFTSSAASVAMATAKATAAAAGQASVTAKSGSVDCTGSATITVLAAPQTGKIVLVLDASTGAPVAGATVKVGTDSGATDATGAYTASVDTGDIHVFAEGYKYLSLIGGNSASVAKVYLSKSGGGVKVKDGTLKFLEGREGDITLGLAGVSIGGSLTEIDLGLRLGEAELAALDCSSLGFSDTIDLPGGLVIELPADLCTGSKPKFNSAGLPGSRAGWALGGKLALNDILPIVLDLAGVISGGDTSNLPIGQILAKVFPFFGSFDHGLDPTLLLTPGNDINGYELALTSRLSIGAIIKAPTLPQAGGAFLDSALVLGGVYDRDFGLVPLGIGVGVDKPDPNATDPADGVITPDEAQTGLKEGELASFFTRAHNGFEERKEYTFLMISTSLSSALGGGAVNLAGIAKRSDTIPTSLDFSGDTFLGFLEGSAFDTSAKKGTFSGTASGEAYRKMTVKLSKTVGTDTVEADWVVYAAGDATEFTLPDAPNDFTFSSTEITAERAKTTGATYNDLFSASSGVSVADLNAIATAFSVWSNKQAE
ncbi:MAG: carboxypeptidase-like regulatory domain-containing protein, partial [Gemmataceae bacterium]|nr:carboxypeptidase-like regulatory domain-containing protein [Gemmataceae bacterium]